VEDRLNLLIDKGYFIVLHSSRNDVTGYLVGEPVLIPF